MEPAITEKLRDYLFGMRELKNPATFPIGIVIVDERERNDALEAVKAEKIPVFGIDRNDNSFHPDTVLEGLASALQKGQGVMLNVQNALPPKITNRLSSISRDNSTYVRPAGGFVVLLVNDELYRDLALEDAASSFCNLTR